MHIITWFARIMSIIFALFISIFALDAFGSHQPLFQQLLGFMIHLLPTYCIVAFIILAWKNEKAGGIFFTILGIIFTWYFQTYRFFVHFLVVSLPLFAIGALFILSGFFKAKHMLK